MFTIFFRFIFCFQIKGLFLTGSYLFCSTLFCAGKGDTVSAGEDDLLGKLTILLAYC